MRMREEYGTAALLRLILQAILKDVLASTPVKSILRLRIVMRLGVPVIHGYKWQAKPIRRCGQLRIVF